MELKFFGNGNGFSNEHTSAYFYAEKRELVIIDCSMDAFQKLKQMKLSECNRIYVLITHTHGDHVGGLGLFLQYAYFVLKKPVTVVAPSVQVSEDLDTLLSIEGVEYLWYESLVVSELNGKDWFKRAIKTEHVPQLKNKCFGYQLMVNGVNVVYTGDTITLEPFLPYLEEKTEFYVDTSVNDGIVHLKLSDALNQLTELAEKRVKVYLMHVDDKVEAEKVVHDIHGIKLVSTN